MASAEQVRGVLLEEAILYLLRVAGYATVDMPDGDTVVNGAAGLLVRGRGSNHQIDAIGDFRLAQPFSHPQRLLVEAKFVASRTRLPIVRNAVGVWMDVREYWNFSGERNPAHR